ncbi:hypothetical protein KYY02_19965 [Streptomyces pimonensis]|uniref:Uncharacterized protein n=1 Tax=Streptomyces pimonensis TaxID=2860288 RepID=A0ABV4J4E1_9ACTN
MGRSPVRQWTGLAYEEGAAADAPAAVAARHRRPVPDGDSRARRPRRRCGSTAGRDGAVLAAAAVSTARWGPVRFSPDARRARDGRRGFRGAARVGTGTGPAAPGDVSGERGPSRPRRRAARTPRGARPRPRRGRPPGSAPAERAVSRTGRCPSAHPSRASARPRASR